MLLFTSPSAKPFPTHCPLHSNLVRKLRPKGKCHTPGKVTQQPVAVSAGTQGFWAQGPEFSTPTITPTPKLLQYRGSQVFSFWDPGLPPPILVWLPEGLTALGAG